MNCLVINHCAHNKGDRAVLTFVIGELASLGATSVAVSCNEPKYYPPARFIGNTKVKAIPQAWNESAGENPTRFDLRLQGIRRRLGYHISSPVLRQLLFHRGPAGLAARLVDRRFADALKSADFVISTGGHHLASSIGRDGIGPASFEMAAALVAGRRLGFWSQTFGPFRFEKTSNRAFIRTVLNRADCIYARDEKIYRLLAKLNYS